MFRKRKSDNNKNSTYIFISEYFPSSSAFFLFLATAWTNIMFYCFDLYETQFQASKTNSSMFS